MKIALVLCIQKDSFLALGTTNVGNKESFFELREKVSTINFEDKKGTKKM